MYIDINAISGCLECFCSKHEIQVEYAKSNLNTSPSQIWVICQLLPFVRVGQNKCPDIILGTES